MNCVILAQFNDVINYGSIYIKQKVAAQKIYIYILIKEL